MSARKTLRNGDIVDVGLTRHKDGKVSIKRKVVAKGCRKAGTITLARTSFEQTSPVASDGPKTKSAARNARKLAKQPKKITAAPSTIKERTHHEHSVDKAAYVTTTNKVPTLLRRIKARTGTHVELFVKDYETVGSDLRSPNMAGAGGGSSGVPFPMAKVQAMDRLRAFEERNMVAFKMCEAVLIYNASPASIHEMGGPQHVVVSHMIREAIEELADFYTPKRKRRDKTLAVLVKLVEEARREREI